MSDTTVIPRCVTGTHYSTHISPECQAGGSAQCDGFCSQHEHTECSCSCHSDWTNDLPSTVVGVKEWHDQEYLAYGSQAEVDAVRASQNRTN